MDNKIKPEYYVRAGQDVVDRLMDENKGGNEETSGDLAMVHELLNEALKRM